MTGRLKDLTVNRDGKQNITVTVNENAGELFDSLKDVECEITIKKLSRKRSGKSWSNPDART